MHAKCTIIFYKWFGVEFVERWNGGRKRALVGGCVELTMTEHKQGGAKRDIIIRFKLDLRDKV